MKYPKVQDGEWVQPVMAGYKMACCDCKLVHRLNFRVVGPVGVPISKRLQVQFQAFRDARATGQKRRNDAPSQRSAR